MSQKTHTTTIDNGFNIPKRDQSQPKQLFTNKKTSEQYLSHPYFKVPQFYDNLITVTYRTSDPNFKVPSTLSQQSILDLHTSINELDDDSILQFIPNRDYQLQTDDRNKPNVHPITNDDTNEEEFLVYATYHCPKSPRRLGIPLTSQ